MTDNYSDTKHDKTPAPSAQSDLEKDATQTGKPTLTPDGAAQVDWYNSGESVDTECFALFKLMYIFR